MLITAWAFVYPAETVAHKLDTLAVQLRRNMATLKRCPVQPTHWHLVGDEPNREVCTSDKVGLRNGLSQGLRLGLINQADGRRLLLEITTHLIIPEQAPTNCGRQPCGYDHNFAVGLLDVLDVMCGTGKSHPDDVA